MNKEVFFYENFQNDLSVLKDNTMFDKIIIVRECACAHVRKLKSRSVRRNSVRGNEKVSLSQFFVKKSKKSIDYKDGKYIELDAVYKILRNPSFKQNNKSLNKKFSDYFDAYKKPESMLLESIEKRRSALVDFIKDEENKSKRSGMYSLIINLCEFQYAHSQKNNDFLDLCKESDLVLCDDNKGS